MSQLRQRMIEDMELHGYAPMTREAYVRAVVGLARYYWKSPESLSEEQVRAYLLYLVREKKVAPSTFRGCLAGIRFLYESTLKKPLSVLDLARPKKRRRLPMVLSRTEIATILSHVRNPVARMGLSLMYSCGLRISEGAQLRVEDIDGAREQVLVHNGKGGRDRCVPLARRTLEQLRE